MDEEDFLVKKLRKYVEQYVFDLDLTSDEALKGMIELVRLYPAEKQTDQVSE